MKSMKRRQKKFSINYPKPRFLTQYKKKKALLRNSEEELFSLHAAGRTRTGMVARLILSQVRLPIPPQRQGYELLPFLICLNIIAQGIEKSNSFLNLFWQFCFGKKSGNEERGDVLWQRINNTKKGVEKLGFSHTFHKNNFFGEKR